jgi:hypothetical protein
MLNNGDIMKEQSTKYPNGPHLMLQMRLYSLLLVLSCFFIFLSYPGFAFTQGRLGGGGTCTSNPTNFIEPEQAAEIQQAVELYEANKARIQKQETITETTLYTFQPTAGTSFGDLFLYNYVDLDPNSTILDWDCGDWTYDGHTAHDVEIRTFGEQAIGVPIFAVQDGTVISTHDGEYDMNRSLNSMLPNYVGIDHGNGRVCYYAHMKKNSVAVSAGEQIAAGQQIGLVGSSGSSTHPHLHFSTYEDGNVVEPQAGYCHPGESLWTNQVAKRTDTYVIDFGISDESLSDFNWPNELPRNVQVTGTDYFYPWIMLGNLPADSSWQIRILKPDNTQWGQWSEFFNGQYRRSWWNWIFYFSGITDYGTWRFLFYVNGTKLLDAPFEVVSSYSPNFNRPPKPVSISFEPGHPTDSDVLVCRVNTDLVLDDMDYDIVRYEYVWKVNGVEVRRIVSAAHSDMIPHNITTSGDFVTCTVTPSDGKENGPIAQIGCIVHEQTCQYKLLGDMDGNCKIDFRDFGLMAYSWLMNCHENPSDHRCIPW